MIFTPGIAVSQLSGSVGGTTASRNKGGQYFRNRAIPTNPSTIDQETVRANLSAESQSWSDRSDEERASWASWAQENPVTNALGNSILLSGHQAYVQIRARQALVGSTLIDLPPISNAPTALASLTLTADIGVGNFEVAFTASPLAAGVHLWVEGALVNSAGITYVRNLYRFLEISSAAQASPFDIETSFTAKFGTPIVGQTAHVRVRTYEAGTGLVSVPLTDSAVVVSTV